MTLTLRYAVRSDLGLVRGNNEDSVYAGPRLLAIADGMGGHAAGEVASKIVISTMEPLDDDTMPGDLIAALRDAVLDANQRIADAVERDEKLDGMGTTLTALRFAGGQVALVHVGDSRAYLVRGNVLSQITHDDTYVQYLVDSGKLTAEEAKDHPRKSVILRALRGAEVEPDVSIRESRAGDRYLLCSDGLSDVVSTETIFETLRIADPQACADRLVELALRSGGPDNVTVIVADVVDSRPGDAVDDVPVRDGAFVDPAAAEVLPTDSAAERAAAMSRPRRAAAASTEQPRRRRRWKAPLIVLAILIVIAGALGGTYAWAQTQYYVGRAGDQVAIFKGVDASFGPIKLSEVYEGTDIKLADLNPSYRSQVESGITASSQGAARQIVTRLRLHLKPYCRPTPTPVPTDPSSPSTSSSAPVAPNSSSGTSTSSGTSSRTSQSGSAGTEPGGFSSVPPPGRSSTSSRARTDGAGGAANRTGVAGTAGTTGTPGTRTTARVTHHAATGTTTHVSAASMPATPSTPVSTPVSSPSATGAPTSASSTPTTPSTSATSPTSSGSPTESPCRPR